MSIQRHSDPQQHAHTPDPAAEAALDRDRQSFRDLIELRQHRSRGSDHRLR